jgi:hypothetical protein
MAATTKSRIQGTGNELYVLATYADGGSEICHIKCAPPDHVDHTIALKGILHPGAYNLIMIAINWGPQPSGTPAPAATPTFKVTLTTGGSKIVYPTDPLPLTAPAVAGVQ